MQSDSDLFRRAAFGGDRASPCFEAVTLDGIFCFLFYLLISRDLFVFFDNGSKRLLRCKILFVSGVGEDKQSEKRRLPAEIRA